MRDEEGGGLGLPWQKVPRQSLKGSDNVQIGSVGAGAVVVSGTVHGSVTVIAPEPLQVDRRAVAETLQAMKPLDRDQHLSVVAWMEREFGTQIVKGLSANSHRRVRRYVAAVLKPK